MGNQQWCMIQISQSTYIASQTIQTLQGRYTYMSPRTSWHLVHLLTCPRRHLHISWPRRYASLALPSTVRWLPGLKSISSWNPQSEGRDARCNICLRWTPWSTPCLQSLTQWGRDIMAAILNTTYSKAFFWMNMNEFHWNLFLMFELKIFQHWLR